MSYTAENSSDVIFIKIQIFKFHSIGVLKMSVVSVLVSVYNAERFIDKCLESLVNQTKKELDILLIDDGSKDKSLQKCHEWAQKDDRIRVFHKENGGLSSARNFGMQYVQGDYVSFIDPDDWIELDMLETVTTQMEQDDSQICISGQIKEYKNKSEKVTPPLPAGCYENGQKDVEILFSLLSNKRMPNGYSFVRSVARNVYKTSFITNNNLSFASEREFFAEDFHFNTTAYKIADKISVCENHFYHYTMSETSLTHIYRENRWRMWQNMINYVSEKFTEYNLMEEAKDQFDCFIVNEAFSCIQNECYAADDSVSKRKRKQNIKEILKDKRVVDGLKNKNIFSFFSKNHSITCKVMKTGSVFFVWHLFRYINSKSGKIF